MTVWYTGCGFWFIFCFGIHPAAASASSCCGKNVGSDVIHMTCCIDESVFLKYFNYYFVTIFIIPTNIAHWGKMWHVELQQAGWLVLSWCHANLESQDFFWI